ncbi:hypothetical protein HOLleu_08096 [Holothuria leucospilota]|uniref:SAM domain-containing protein n=1 Tax=Holothuria leucospilota TaxID=206669 RepID=A0A9Q1CGZ8_HOLLE|nr:hypothetical protein HOLleu_08096 [Holothuria leucospilota]
MGTWSVYYSRWLICLSYLGTIDEDSENRTSWEKLGKILPQRLIHVQQRMEHDIVGKVLVQLSTSQLQQMGIRNEKHRVDIYEKIIKLRLKHEQVELKLLRKTPQTPKPS